MRNLLFRAGFLASSAAVLLSCGQGTTENQSQIERSLDVKIVEPSDVVVEKRTMNVTCPLQIDRYDEAGSEPGYPFTVTGFCPNDGTFPTELEFRTEITQALSDSSSFSVINSESYDTIGLKRFFTLDENTNNFILTKENASEMWSTLEKGHYQFSSNIISEDFELAESYSFQFEIK